MNYFPEPTGIGKYSGEMGEWLSQAGHEIRVIAAPPYYPNWKRNAKYSFLQYKKRFLIRLLFIDVHYMFLKTLRYKENNTSFKLCFF